MPFNNTATPAEVTGHIAAFHDRNVKQFGWLDKWPEELCQEFRQLLVDGITAVNPQGPWPLDMESLRALHELRKLQLDFFISTDDIPAAAETARRSGPLALVMGDLGYINQAQHTIALHASDSGQPAEGAKFYLATAATSATLGNVDTAEHATHMAEQLLLDSSAQTFAATPAPVPIPPQPATPAPAPTPAQPAASAPAPTPASPPATDWDAVIADALRKDERSGLQQLEAVLAASGTPGGPNDDQLADAIIHRVELAFDSFLPPAAVEDIHEVSWEALGKLTSAPKFTETRDRFHDTITAKWDKFFDTAVERSFDIQMVRTVLTHSVSFLGLDFGPTEEQLTDALRQMTHRILMAEDADLLSEFSVTVIQTAQTLPNKSTSGALLKNVGLAVPRQPNYLPLRELFLQSAMKEFRSDGNEAQASFVDIELALDFVSQRKLKEAHDVLTKVHRNAQVMGDLQLICEVTLHLSRSWAFAKRFDTAIGLINRVLNSNPLPEAKNAETRRLIGKLLMEKARYMHAQAKGNTAQMGVVHNLVSAALEIFMAGEFTEEMAEANYFLKTGSFQ